MANVSSPTPLYSEAEFAESGLKRLPATSTTVATKKRSSKKIKKPIKRVKRSVKKTKTTKPKKSTNDRLKKENKEKLLPWL